MDSKQKEVLLTAIDTYKETIDLFLKGSWSDEELTLLQLIDALIDLAQNFISEKEVLEVIDEFSKTDRDIDNLLDEWWKGAEDIHLPLEVDNIGAQLEAVKLKIENM